MIRVYYTLEKTDSKKFPEKIFKEYLRLTETDLILNRYGKPYLRGNEVYFNLSHSGCMTALAVSEAEIGLDCEKIRNRSYHSVLKIFSEREQQEIDSYECFLRHWTVKESFVKFLGTSIAKELKDLEYFDQKLYLKGEEQRISLLTSKIEEYLLTVCTLAPQEIEYINV